MGDEVVQTPFGKFLVNERDLIESTLKAGTLWDGPGFLQPIAIEHGRLGEPGVTILDVGANVGAFSVWLASRGAWRVIAVEPVPETRRRLVANLDLNKDTCADRVIVIDTAATDRAGRFSLAAPYDPTNQGGTRLVDDPEGSIPGVPLDDYRAFYGSGVSLIKIDTEGMDLRVVHGLVKVILRDTPTIVIEHPDTLYMRELPTELQHTYGWSRWPSHPDNMIGTPY